MKVNSFKRILAVLLVVCMTCSLTVTAFATEAVDPSASIALSVSVSGSTVTASVNLTSINTNAAGLDFALNYDSSKVSYTSSSTNLFACRVVDKGSYLSFSGFDNAGVTTTGSIATATFTVLDSATGSASFSLSGVVMGAQDGSSIPCSYSGGGSYEVAGYIVTVNSAANGTITASGSKVFSGNTVTLTTAPADGYGVEAVTVTDASGAAVAVTTNGNTHTFTMPKSNVTVSASFKEVDYTVTAGTVTNGKISLSASSANYGDTVTFTVTPNEGYEVDKVAVSGATVEGSNGSYSFTMPAQNVTVTATVKAKTFSISKSTATGGTISVASTASFNSTVTVTVTPDKGYACKSVTFNGTAAKSAGDNKYTFTMPAADVTVAATFEQVPYTVTKGTITGKGSISIDKTGAKYGETITVTATPATGYETASVTVSGVTVTKTGDNTFTFPMPDKDVTVNATFKGSEYSISTKAGKHGSISVVSKAGYEATVTVTLTPDAGYNVDTITVTDAKGNTISTKSAGTNKYSFTMPASNVKVEASFVEVPYTVTLNKVYNGTASVNKTSANYGETVTVTAKANDGYYVEYVYVADAKGKSVAVTAKNNKYTFTMPESDVKVTVSIVGQAYDILTDGIENGKVTVSNRGNSGSTIEFTVTPDDGYKTTAVQVQTPAGGKITTKDLGNGKYSFVMPASKVSILPTFEAVEYAIICEPTENGTFTVDAESAVIDTVINVSVKAEENYQLNTITITDAKGNLVSYTGEGEAYSFVMPASDVTVAVVFEEIPEVLYNITIGETQNGTITLSKDTAGPGSTVTVTAAPAEGYKLAAIQVADGSGNNVATNGSENVYTFEMPESDVIVVATFEELPPPVDEEVPQVEPVPEKTMSPLVWIIPAALLVVAAIIVLVLILTKKKTYTF